MIQAFENLQAEVAFLRDIVNNPEKVKDLAERHGLFKVHQQTFNLDQAVEIGLAVAKVLGNTVPMVQPTLPAQQSRASLPAGSRIADRPEDYEAPVPLRAPPPGNLGPLEAALRRGYTG